MSQRQEQEAVAPSSSTGKLVLDEREVDDDSDSDSDDSHDAALKLLDEAADSDLEGGATASIMALMSPSSPGGVRQNQQGGGGGGSSTGEKKRPAEVPHVYKDEAASHLGRSVEILFENPRGGGAEVFYPGVIRAFKVELVDSSDADTDAAVTVEQLPEGLVSIQHFVKFEDGDEGWFDLKEEEDAGGLRWKDGNRKGGAGSRAAKRIRSEQQVESPKPKKKVNSSNKRSKTKKKECRVGGGRGTGNIYDAANPKKCCCIPLDPIPIPFQFPGDMKKYKSALVPKLVSLINYWARPSTKHKSMFRCTMCGNDYPFGSGKEETNGNSNNKVHMIPDQKICICTSCEAKVWVVLDSGLLIKHCRGCKDFRPWAAFGQEGGANQCATCRHSRVSKQEIKNTRKRKHEQQKAALVRQAKK